LLSLYQLDLISYGIWY